MCYYFDEDEYYYNVEPTREQELFDDLREKFKEYLNEDIKAEFEKLTARNETLEKENRELRSENSSLKSQKRNAEWEAENIKKKAEEEFYDKAITEVFQRYIEDIDVWYAECLPHERPKCEYCDDNRMLRHTFPNGETLSTSCTCRQKDYWYEPKIATASTLQYRIKPSRYKSERKYYIDNYRAYHPTYNDDYSYADFKILHILDTFDENAKELYNKLGYGEELGFRTEEACQKYCDYLNEEKKKKVRE